VAVVVGCNVDFVVVVDCTVDFAVVGCTVDFVVEIHMLSIVTKTQHLVKLYAVFL